MSKLKAIVRGFGTFLLVIGLGMIVLALICVILAGLKGKSIYLGESFIICLIITGIGAALRETTK